MTRPPSPRKPRAPRTPPAPLPDPIRYVIMSRARADILPACSLSLFPDADVCVDEREADAYRPITRPEKLMLHPPLAGQCAIRNWILDTLKERIVVILDDDLEYVVSYVGIRTRRSKEPDDIRQIVENAATCAEAFRSYLFGFNQTFDPKTFAPQDPIRLNRWLGTVMGFIGRDTRVRWDDSLKLRGGIEISLRALLFNRIIYTGARFHFVSTGRFKKRGGASADRSAERERQELDTLKRRWGKFITFGQRGGFGAKIIKAKTTVLHVPRRQA